MTATTVQPKDIKLLALKVLERNKGSNKSATRPKTKRNFEATKSPQQLRERTQEKRYPYRFVLRAGAGGGTYLTGTRNVDQVRAELTRTYGNRLLLVTVIGSHE